jgi:hypothetical protein
MSKGRVVGKLCFVICHHTSGERLCHTYLNCMGAFYKTQCPIARVCWVLFIGVFFFFSWGALFLFQNLVTIINKKQTSHFLTLELVLSPLKHQLHIGRDLGKSHYHFTEWCLTLSHSTNSEMEHNRPIVYTKEQYLLCLLHNRTGHIEPALTKCTIYWMPCYEWCYDAVCGWIMSTASVSGFNLVTHYVRSRSYIKAHR